MRRRRAGNGDARRAFELTIGALALVLALGSSVVWGCADFGGGSLARRLPVLAPAADVDSEIRKAFIRNAGLDADNIGITTSGGTVRLSGTVRSWEELEAAVAAAAAAPGVKDVDNQLKVAY